MLMTTKKRFRFCGTRYEWNMTGWQATVIVTGSVGLLAAGFYCMVLIMSSMPL